MMYKTLAATALIIVFGYGNTSAANSIQCKVIEVSPTLECFNLKQGFIPRPRLQLAQMCDASLLAQCQNDCAYQRDICQSGGRDDNIPCTQRYSQCLVNCQTIACD